MKMEICKKFKCKKIKDKTKQLGNVIGLVIVITAILTLLLQFSDKNKSSYQDETLEKSLEMNTHLLDSLRYKISAFNTEYNSLTGVCSTPLNKSIIFDDENRLDDDETTFYSFYKLGLISCEDLLMKLRHSYIKSYNNKFEEVIKLNEEILTRKDRGNIWGTLANWLYTILIMLFLIILFLYIKLIKEVR